VSDIDDDIENDPENLSGFYDDNGNRLNPDLVFKPALCLSCRHDNDPKEESLCILNRLDQAEDEGEFQCGAYEQRNPGEI
jgi:hypothetical protein